MIFTIPGNPKGKARARTFYNSRLGRSQSVTPEKTVLYENYVKECYLTAKKREKWFDGEPLQMYITAFFDIPKSTSKKKRQKMLKEEVLPTKKPDIDNIAKVICDALNGIAYHDDTQIVSLNVSKVYAETEPRVLVGIYKYEPEEKDLWQE